MVNSSSLTITATGSTAADGNVALTELRALLDNLSQCLRLVESVVAGTTSLQYLITGLETGSATVTLTPAPSKKARNAGVEVIGTFSNTVRQIEKGESIDTRFKEDDLLKFRKMVEPFQRGGRKLKIAGTNVTSQFLANVDKIISGSIPSHGTVKGRLERLNVHLDKNEFTLYPPIDGYSVTCRFEDYLFETVQKAIKQNVTIYGKLFFKPDSPFPERVHVESVEIHPPDKELPTLRSLRGIIPDATEGLGAVEFVNALKND